MASQWERKVLDRLGNASRSVAIANQCIALTLQMLATGDRKKFRSEDLRSVGHQLVSLAGALTDLGVEIAADADKVGDRGPSGRTT